MFVKIILWPVKKAGHWYMRKYAWKWHTVILEGVQDVNVHKCPSCGKPNIPQIAPCPPTGCDPCAEDPKPSGC